MKLKRIDLVKAVQLDPGRSATDVIAAVPGGPGGPALELEFDPELEVVEVLRVTPPEGEKKAASREIVLIIPRDNVAAMRPL